MSKFKCSSCEYTSNQKGNVQRHIDNMSHDKEIIVIPVEIKCDKCNSIFTTIPVLKNHLKICGIVKPKKESLKDKNGLPIKICSDCNKNSNEVDFHIRIDKMCYRTKRCKTCQYLYRLDLKRRDITDEVICLTCKESSEDIFFDYEKIGANKIYYSNCKECRNKEKIKERICHNCNKSSYDTEFRVKKYGNDFFNYSKFCNICELKEYRSYKYKIKVYKRGAKDRNLSWNLTDQEVIDIFEQKCYYCSQEKTDEYFIGIDRVDNNEGYILENCVSCCGMCNFMKSAFIQEDFIQKCREIANSHPE